MRYIKTIDDITKDGRVTFGDGYEFVTEAKKPMQFSCVRPTCMAMSCLKAFAPSRVAAPV